MSSLPFLQTASEMAAQRDALCGAKTYPFQPLHGMKRTINNFRELILEKDPQPVNPPSPSRGSGNFLDRGDKDE